MDVSYDAKLNTVRQWLAALARQHGDVPLPAWRETPSAVDKLYLLYCKNKRNDEMCRRIISHTTSLTKQFESETITLQGSMASVGVAPEHLSVSGMMSLHSLTSLAMSLDLKDTVTSSYMMALNDMELEETELSLSREAMSQQIDQLLQRTSSAVSELEAMKRLLATCVEEVQSQQATIDAQASNMAYLNSKSNEYLDTVARLKEHVTASGATSEIYHSTLVSLYERLQAIQQQAAPINDRLKSFKNLPSDVGMARVFVQQEEQRLKELEQELEERISNLDVHT